MGKRRGGGREGGRKGRDEGREKGRVGRGSWCPPPPRSTCLRHAPTSIAAAEKCPSSYQNATICPHGSKLWCSDLAIDNALRG